MLKHLTYASKKKLRAEMLITRAGTYQEVYDAFQWRLPARYNIAADVCDRHAADPSKVALIHERPDGAIETYTFLRIQRSANRLANALRHFGLGLGDRVILLLGQNPATGIAHVACWKAGMISVPTSTLFGADAVEYRVRATGARVLITDRANYPKVAEIRDRTPTLENVLLIDGEESGALAFWDVLERASDDFDTLSLTPDTPAFINFTSGTTGWPKGALQGHRSMLGHLPGIEFLMDFLPQPGDVLWSPADWAWLAGLMDILMPGWFHGLPVLTYRASAFDAEKALSMMGKHKVRATLLTPTMLKLIRQVREPKQRFGIDLRVVLSGSEAVGQDLHEQMADILGAPINEGFGQTEANCIVGNCSLVMPTHYGSLGRSLPGHVAGVVDDEGRPLPPRSIGNLALKAPDPVMLLEYWRDPEATKAKFAGEWMITGDLAESDEDGYLWFRGRKDDVITSSGYRIGPTEIEDAIVRHPKVTLAAAIGVPDPERTERIKAFVVLAKGCDPTPELAEEIRVSVRDRLARHEYPREIEFVETLPMTATGKILRRELRQREAERRGREIRKPDPGGS
jgi:acetyl-CoA synthetase